jgi:Flp pilus assembly protein TadG
MTTGQIVRRFFRDQDGASGVEFAICGSFLIFLSLGVVEFGRAFMIRNEVAYAADKATRTVLMNPSASTTAITQSARDAFQENDSLLTVSVADETVDGLSSRVITLTYPVELLVPALSTTSFDVTVSRRVSRG